MNELKTIRDLVRWGTSRFNEAGLFFGHGTDNALDESLSLVLHALHLDYSLPEAYLDTRLSVAEKTAVTGLLQRRIDERIPAAYLTGRSWFAGLEFIVNEHVLVPRSPIAELLERGFEPWIEADSVSRVLDLCTGSGCIAIAAAHYLPQAEVDAVDISTDALDVAGKNVARHDLEERVFLHQGNLYEALPDGQRFDVIVSNPPYVSHEEYRDLPGEYHREPALGLEADDEGLAIVVKILREASARLNPGGIIVVEVGNSAKALERRYPDAPFTWLEFEHGGEGVFLLTAEQLKDYSFYK